MDIVVVFVVGILIVGAVVLLLFMADETFKKRLADAEDAQRGTIQWLRREREAARLRNDIEWTKEQAELRPFILETKKAILQGKADKRLLDAVFARRALDDVLSAHPAQTEEDPITAAAEKLLEEIESRKADGQETDDLEAALRALRGMRGSAS
jgi:hypothetical protein